LSDIIDDQNGRLKKDCEDIGDAKEGNEGETDSQNMSVKEGRQLRRESQTPE
jgi:hypothetical protein